MPSYFIIPEELWPTWTLSKHDYIGQTDGQTNFTEAEIVEIRRISEEFFALQKRLAILSKDDGIGPIMCDSLIDDDDD